MLLAAYNVHHRMIAAIDQAKRAGTQFLVIRLCCQSIGLRAAVLSLRRLVSHLKHSGSDAVVDK